ncbi:uncharacterized protein LOC129619280 isoform X2 [Condylostylus longicornis]|nr:uncharacterized protein LOC129619280 isoform X2 [Condylostylus longicornis]XP_055390432.1 uncharacterized protein LOC129619280 isoform X2 [Condylostylus longicornis]
MDTISTDSKQIIIKYRNNNYDITEFIHKHPGGINTLKGITANTDITKRFLNAPPHSDAAMYLMNEYKINMENKMKNGYKNGTKNCIKENNMSINDIPNNISNGHVHNNNHNNDIILDESMEHLVDWSKPMLRQIVNIAECYDEWVHKPVDRPLRLFGPWYLEMLTKTPWWLVPSFWVPSIIYILYSEISTKRNTSLNNSTVLFYCITGVFLWTLIEYVLHRWVFHIKVSPGNKKLCIFHFLLHGLHHKVPFDPYRLVFPPIPAVILASILYLPVIAIFPFPRIVLSGGLFGYLCYDMMHYYLHYGNPKFFHMYQMKRYHYQHHFAHQDIGFGITSPIWDIVFRTRIYLRRLKFMIKW